MGGNVRLHRGMMRQRATGKQKARECRAFCTSGSIAYGAGDTVSTIGTATTGLTGSLLLTHTLAR